MCNNLMMFLHNEEHISVDGMNNQQFGDSQMIGRMNNSLSSKESNDQKHPSDLKSMIAENKSESLPRPSKSLSLNESRLENRLSTSSQSDSRIVDFRLPANVNDQPARISQVVSSNCEAPLWNSSLRALGDSDHFEASFLAEKDPKGTPHNIDWSLGQ